MTKKEKQKAGEDIIKEMLEGKSYTATELIEKAAEAYTARHGDKTDNPNDVRGRIGSILDTMKKNEDSGLQFDGGVYALKKTEEAKPAKAKRAKKTEKTETPETAKPAKKTTRKKKTETAIEQAKEEKNTPLPAQPLQPIAPVVPVTPEVAPDAAKPKKRTKKAKAEEIKPAVEEKKEAEKVEEKQEVKLEEKKDDAPKGTVMDMSFLFGEVKPAVKREEAPRAKYEPVKAEVKTQEVKTEEKKVEQTPPPPKTQTTEKSVRENKSAPAVKSAKPTRPSVPTRRSLTADEKLQDAFLARLRRLGGEYFEYYSIYLLEKYSRKNGRRLEGLCISGGDHDGGIDGEIELTDRLGFRETIYIQAKNWDPDKGDEKQWTVGETLLQQFIGACVCRQAKQGKQSCRGAFVTTSRFTPDAKRILAETDAQFVGYDGSDLYEIAKECSFGLIKKNGEWTLDENLLSGMRAFYSMS